MISTLIINATLKRNTHVNMSTIPSQFFFNLTVTLQAPKYKLSLETVMSFKNKKKTQNHLTKKRLAEYLRVGFHLDIILGDEAVFSAELCLVPVLIALFV